MMKTYIDFFCEGVPNISSKCTTVWPNNVTCQIILSGSIENIFHNIMVFEMDDEHLLDNWISENSDKVLKMTKEDINILGQQILPPGTEILQRNLNINDPDIILIAQEFDVDNLGNLFVVKDS